MTWRAPQQKRAAHFRFGSKPALLIRAGSGSISAIIPKAAKHSRGSKTSLRARNRNCVLSFKDFVGTAGQRQWDGDAERLGGLEVQEQFDLSGLLNWQVGGLLALENPSGIDAGQAVGVPNGTAS